MGLISPQCRVRPPDPPLTGYANLVKRRGREPRDCGFDSHLGHSNDPVVQRIRRLADIQESDGSTPSGITYWSVGVSVARVLGKDEGRVQFPGGPLATRWGVGPTGRRLACNQEIGVRLPDAPLAGSWSNGTTLARQASPVLLETWRVQFPVGPLIWKVAGYGSPGRFAKPCDSTRVTWVQIPCLPLCSLKTYSPMVKRMIILRF